MREQFADAGIKASDGRCEGLYVIYDKAAQQPGPIFSAITDAVAIRQYRRLVVDQHVDIADYELLCVGYFDRQNLCVIEECKIVVNADDLKAMDKVDRLRSMEVLENE